jgi:hypothetical protein
MSFLSTRNAVGVANLTLYDDVVEWSMDVESRNRDGWSTSMIPLYHSSVLIWSG